MRKTVGILGTPIDILNTGEVLERLELFIQQRRFHQVATANTDFLINVLADPELQHILRNADLVVPDGMPVVWAARQMRSHLPERVTGAGLVPKLAETAARKGYRIFMLGGKPEIALRAKANLERDYPGVQIVGCISPPLAPLIEMDHAALLDEIERAKPDILLVAFGNPKQEKWINLNRERLCAIPVPVCIGVGGTFDFLAQQVGRAPEWIQRNGLEWAFRFVQEPRRLGPRYIRDMLQFTRYLPRQWWALRRKHSQKQGEITAEHKVGMTRLTVVGDLDATILPRFQALADDAFTARTHLTLDFKGLTSLDGEALGTLINLPKRAAHYGCEVRLDPLPPSIATMLRDSQMHNGLYEIAKSEGIAFSNGYRMGLCCRKLIGKDAAVVVVNGASDKRNLPELEKICAELLDAGKRVDLDARGVTYTDSHLLSLLSRMARRQPAETTEGVPGCESRFRIIPGASLRATLKRERLLNRFVLCESPEMPSDAVEDGAAAMQALTGAASEPASV